MQKIQQAAVKVYEELYKGMKNVFDEFHLVEIKVYEEFPQQKNNGM